MEKNEGGQSKIWLPAALKVAVRAWCLTILLCSRLVGHTASEPHWSVLRGKWNAAYEPDPFGSGGSVLPKWEIPNYTCAEREWERRCRRWRCAFVITVWMSIWQVYFVIIVFFRCDYFGLHNNLINNLLHVQHLEMMCFPHLNLLWAALVVT